MIRSILSELAEFRHLGRGLRVAADDASIWTIEGMKGQEYSIGIFFFMLAGVVVFVAIILKFILSAWREKTLKKGEFILLMWILAGTFVAVAFGALQLLHGRLF